MVALNQMMPPNPSDKDFVERTLQQHPSLTRFVERIQKYSSTTFSNATIRIDALAYDEWDPPLLLEITADIPQVDYVERLHELRRWAQSDPDYDPELITVMLLVRAPAQTR